MHTHTHNIHSKGGKQLSSISSKNIYKSHKKKSRMPEKTWRKKPFSGNPKESVISITNFPSDFSHQVTSARQRNRSVTRLPDWWWSQPCGKPWSNESTRIPFGWLLVKHFSRKHGGDSKKWEEKKVSFKVAKLQSPTSQVVGLSFEPMTVLVLSLWYLTSFILFILYFRSLLPHRLLCLLIHLSVSEKGPPALSHPM